MAQQLKRYFVGFSTQNSAQDGIRTLYDINLIKVDLMTAFQTRVGERVMRGAWGCKLWDYLMEPMTPLMRDQIVTEAERIVRLDQRLAWGSGNVTELQFGFSIEMTVAYQPWNVIETFSITFEQNESAYFSV